MNRAFVGVELTVARIQLLLGVGIQFTNSITSYFVRFSLCPFKIRTKEEKKENMTACSCSQLSWVIFFLIMRLYTFTFVFVFLETRVRTAE